MPWFDCGLNLFSPQFNGEEQAIIQAAKAAGVEKLLLISSDLAETQRNLQFSLQHPCCYATAGVHPHQAAHVESNWLADLTALLKTQAVVAIGECGLDFNRDFSPRAIQQHIFAEQLQLALRHDKAVYLHERDAFDTQVAILREQSPSRGIAHCFTGNVTQLKTYLDLGLYIGITGWICDERRGQELQQAVNYIPRDRLILETDAPYLLPRTIRPRPKRNSPALLPAIASEVARLTGRELEALAAETYANSCRLFQLQET